jgi:transcription elongation GreA/GreB family factor
MTATKARAALKKAVQDKLMSLEAAELATAKAHYESYLKESRLDSRETRDTDDLADARENADLAAAFDHPVHTHHAKIDAIENADFSLTDTVRPGAVVAFNGKHFVVIVSTAKFECGGETYMGISTQSPIYKAMQGLKAGESFTFNGQEIVLDDVM